MTDKTQPEALRLANNIHCGDSACKCSLNLAAAELLRQHARIVELEAQLEAVGAGGVPLYGGDSYGDGNVYRGTRSADSAVRTYTVHDLAHAKGVPRIVTNAMLAMSEKLAEALDKLYVLEEVANRLSVDLECMTLDPTNAHWHDTANESLQRYRDLMDAWYPQDHVSPLGKD